MDNIIDWTNPIIVTTDKNILGNNKRFGGNGTSQGFNITDGTHSFNNITMQNFLDWDILIGEGSEIEITGTSNFTSITNISKLIIDGTANIGTLKGTDFATGSLTLKENSILNLANSTSLGVMQGIGLLSIGNGFDGKGLTVQKDSLGITSGSLFADTLTLESGSSASFTNITANSITINGELNTSESRLSAGALSTTSGEIKGVQLHIPDIDSMMTGSGGIPHEYFVYNQAGADWSLFNFTEASKLEINEHVREGNDLLLTTNGNNLTLTMQDSTDRLWKTSENFAVTASNPSANLSVLSPIYYATTGKMVAYDILGTVDKVYVDADFTIDLTDIDLDPNGWGMTIQNLTGDEGKSLTVLGKSADESLVSFNNTQESFAQNAVYLKNVTAKVQTFASEVFLDLNSLTLNNSALNVVSPYGSGITGDTGISVKQVNSASDTNDHSSSKIAGLLSVYGAGGVYLGSYENAIINALTGANQTLKAGTGLTLSGDGGYLTIIEQMGAEIKKINTTGANLIFSYEGSTDANAALNLASDSTMTGGQLHIFLSGEFIEEGVAQTIFTGSALTLNDTEVYVDASFADPTKKEINTDTLAKQDTVLAILHDNLTANNTDVVLGDALLSRYFVNPELVEGKIIADLKVDNFNNISQSLGIASSTLKSHYATTNAIENYLGVATSSVTGMPAGSTVNGVSMWVTPLYNHSTTDGFEGTTSKSDSTTNLAGIALGADKLFANDYRLGVALSTGYGQTEAKGITDSENDFNFYGLSLYGSKDVNDITITADAGFTFIQNDMTEDLSAFNTDNSKADADSYAVSIGVMAEKTFDIQTFKFTPYAGLRYTHLYTDSYALKNSYGVLSTTKSATQNVVQIPVGVMLEKEMNLNNNWSIKPTAKVGIIASFGDLEAKSESKITGFSGTQTYKMDNIDTVTFDGGLGIELKKDNLAIDFGYNLLASPHEHSHNVSANIKWTF